MQQSDWEQVVADGYRVPEGAALDDLTIELVGMLGNPDPRQRDDLAYAVLATWISEGVYDDLLAGLGDGVSLGLRQGLGEDGTATVFRRSFSAVALAAAVARDNAIQCLPPAVVLTWADRAVAWLLAERDLRGWVPGNGWAHTMAHGADLVAALSASRYLGVDELTVLLDVIAERLLAPTDHRLVSGEDDRLAYATMSLLHRDLIPTDAVESWVDRLSSAWAKSGGADGPGSAIRANAVAYLRALHLQLLLGVTGTPAQDVAARPAAAPSVRADALIALQHALRSSAPWMYRQPDAS